VPLKLATSFTINSLFDDLKAWKSITTTPDADDDDDETAAFIVRHDDNDEVKMKTDGLPQVLWLLCVSHNHCTVRPYGNELFPAWPSSLMVLAATVLKSS